MKIEGTSLRTPINDAIRVSIQGGEMHVISRNSPGSVPFKSIFTLRPNFSITVNSKIGGLSIDGKPVDGVKAVHVSDKNAKIVRFTGDDIEFPASSRSQCVITA
jgi:hypothetical protein